MINIVNKSIGYFYEQIKHKKLYMFGAGKRAGYLCNTYHLENNLEAIIDNNSDLYNKELELYGKQIRIISVETFINAVKKEGIENVILIISAVYSAWTIIEQLDAIKDLNGLDCYLGRLLDDCVEKQQFEYTKGEQLIPKKIHYCWFGHAPIPDHLLRYMDSWKKYCPDYEIIRWDESNYDVKKNRYMREAYECKRWGFVPDYARLDIIYQEGGIYFDTDVELVKSPDELLRDKMFCGFISGGLIGLGLGFGACKKNQLIKELRDVYNNCSFIGMDGRQDFTSCSWYEHPVFEKYKFKIDGNYQKREGNVIYPPEVLSPLGASGIASNFTSNTISIHHAELSWITSKEKEEFTIFHNSIRKRLLNS